MTALARALTLFGLLLALAGCGETTTSTFCSYSSDCPEEGARFCVNGVCQAEQCQTERDCADGLLCVEGVCSD